MTKYTKEIKLAIYHEWVDDHRRGTYLSQKYGMGRGGIQYLVDLIQKHGEDILDRPQQKYTANFKLAAIDRVLLGGEALSQVSLDLGLTNTGILANWLRSFKENGYTVITKKKGRPPKNAQKQGQTTDQRTGRAGKETYSRACIHKKIGGLNSRTEEPRKEELARAITELRQELRLSVKYIIDVINANPGLPHISRSNYYYQTHKLDKDSGNQKLMDRIKEIFLEHSQRYGYRRIYGQLRREDYEVNHKKVQRLMQKMGLFAISIRKRRKYSSYYGVQGKIKPDLIKRKFYAIIPNRHWFTDVTEFHLKDQKLYLSPIIDGCTQEIISYNISRHPDLKQVMTMLDDAFEKHPALNGLIFHSDRGWQYQHQAYQAALANRGIDQSMSRLGNSLDDGLMEGFFGIFKREMFYGQEHKYKDLNELEQAIHEYIDYYNNVRIKTGRKNMTPIEYRNHVLTTLTA